VLASSVTIGRTSLKRTNLATCPAVSTLFGTQLRVVDPGDASRRTRWRYVDGRSWEAVLLHGRVRIRGHNCFRLAQGGAHCARVSLCGPTACCKPG
jgi:hypothetical protein